MICQFCQGDVPTNEAYRIIVPKDKNPIIFCRECAADCVRYLKKIDEHIISTAMPTATTFDSMLKSFYSLKEAIIDTNSAMITANQTFKVVKNRRPNLTRKLPNYHVRRSARRT